MRKIFIIILCFVSYSSFASLKSCKVYKTWLEGKSSLQICEENGGSFCASAQNKGQGICYGAKASFCSSVKNIGEGVCLAANGSFCSTVENTAQGICYALNESFCSTLGEDKNIEMITKLKEACNIDLDEDS